MCCNFTLVFRSIRWSNIQVLVHFEFLELEYLVPWGFNGPVILSRGSRSLRSAIPRGASIWSRVMTVYTSLMKVKTGVMRRVINPLIKDYKAMRLHLWRQDRKTVAQTSTEWPRKNSLKKTGGPVGLHMVELLLIVSNKMWRQNSFRLKHRSMTKPTWT